MYHPRGYGGYLVDDTVFLPDGQEAFVTCDTPLRTVKICNILCSYFLSDNEGPPNITEYPASALHLHAACAHLAP